MPFQCSEMKPELSRCRWFEKAIFLTLLQQYSKQTGYLLIGWDDFLLRKIFWDGSWRNVCWCKYQRHCLHYHVVKIPSMKDTCDQYLLHAAAKLCRKNRELLPNLERLIFYVCSWKSVVISCVDSQFFTVRKWWSRARNRSCGRIHQQHD